MCFFVFEKNLLSIRENIEEGLKQKTRQNVVVLDWGSRSKAALGNFGVHCVHFPFTFVGGMFYVDLYFEFLYRNSKKSIQYNRIAVFARMLQNI